MSPEGVRSGLSGLDSLSCDLRKDFRFEKTTSGLSGLERSIGGSGTESDLPWGSRRVLL